MDVTLATIKHLKMIMTVHTIATPLPDRVSGQGQPPALGSHPTTTNT